MTKIEYADETLNPVAGCSPCSPGCDNCYAARAACGRFLKDHPLYKGLAVNNKWTGEVRTCFDIGRQGILEKPLHWKQPRTIFVGNMGDLFHPKINIGFLTHVFDVIEQCPQHKFLILTKRPEQALKMMWGKHGEGWRYFGDGGFHKNLWFGTTICNQAEADEKIPILLQMPAAKRWLSIEPTLEGMEIEIINGKKPKIWNCMRCGWKGHDEKLTGGNISINCPECNARNTLGAKHKNELKAIEYYPKIDWVVIGCESGPNRRPCHLKWMIDVVQQCQAAGVRVFVKQVDIVGTVSHNPDEWPEKLRVRETI